MKVDRIIELYNEALAGKLDSPQLNDGHELWFYKQDNGEGQRIITITSYKKNSAVKKLYHIKTEDGWDVYWRNHTKSKNGMFFPFEWLELPWRKV